MPEKTKKIDFRYHFHKHFLRTEAALEIATNDQDFAQKLSDYSFAPTPSLLKQLIVLINQYELQVWHEAYYGRKTSLSEQKLDILHETIRQLKALYEEERKLTLHQGALATPDQVIQKQQKLKGKINHVLNHALSKNACITKSFFTKDGYLYDLLRQAQDTAFYHQYPNTKTIETADQGQYKPGQTYLYNSKWVGHQDVPKIKKIAIAANRLRGQTTATTPLKNTNQLTRPFFKLHQFFKRILLKKPSAAVNPIPLVEEISKSRRSWAWIRHAAINTYEAIKDVFEGIKEALLAVPNWLKIQFFSLLMDFPESLFFKTLSKSIQEKTKKAIWKTIFPELPYSTQIPQKTENKEDDTYIGLDGLSFLFNENPSEIQVSFQADNEPVFHIEKAEAFQGVYTSITPQNPYQPYTLRQKSLLPYALDVVTQLMKGTADYGIHSPITTTLAAATAGYSWAAFYDPLLPGHHFFVALGEAFDKSHIGQLGWGAFTPAQILILAADTFEHTTNGWIAQFVQFSIENPLPVAIGLISAYFLGDFLSREIEFIRHEIGTSPELAKSYIGLKGMSVIFETLHEREHSALVKALLLPFQVIMPFIRLMWSPLFGNPRREFFRCLFQLKNVLVFSIDTLLSLTQFSIYLTTAALLIAPSAVLKFTAKLIATPFTVFGSKCKWIEPILKFQFWLEHQFVKFNHFIETQKRRVVEGLDAFFNRKQGQWYLQDLTASYQKGSWKGRWWSEAFTSHMRPELQQAFTGKNVYQKLNTHAVQHQQQAYQNQLLQKRLESLHLKQKRIHKNSDKKQLVYTTNPREFITSTASQAQNTTDEKMPITTRKIKKNEQADLAPLKLRKN